MQGNPGSILAAIGCLLVSTFSRILRASYTAGDELYPSSCSYAVTCASGSRLPHSARNNTRQHEGGEDVAYLCLERVW
jgi:hypothetical protein